TEEKLREQEALARLGQMAAVVAHEIKNPIAGIRGALQVIGARMPADARDKPVVGEIIARLDSLNVIVHDLLVFARPRPPQLQPVPVGSLLLVTIEMLRSDPAYAGLDIAVPAEEAVVLADPEQLQIAFQNIVINAAQAMNGSGPVRIDLLRENGSWRIAFCDQGPGMPPEVRAPVFEPFFTTKHRGTGLGLPIARRIVEARGGRMQIAVPENGGTVVAMWLPDAPSALRDFRR